MRTDVVAAAFILAVGVVVAALLLRPEPNASGPWVPMMSPQWTIVNTQTGMVCVSAPNTDPLCSPSAPGT